MLFASGCLSASAGPSNRFVVLQDINQTIQGGGARTYEGILPIDIDNDQNIVGLNVSPTDDWNGLFDGLNSTDYGRLAFANLFRMDNNFFGGKTSITDLNVTELLVLADLNNDGSGSDANFNNVEADKYYGDFRGDINFAVGLPIYADDLNYSRLLGGSQEVLSHFLAETTSDGYLHGGESTFPALNTSDINITTSFDDLDINVSSGEIFVDGNIFEADANVDFTLDANSHYFVYVLNDGVDGYVIRKTDPFDDDDNNEFAFIGEVFTEPDHVIHIHVHPNLHTEFPTLEQSLDRILGKIVINGLLVIPNISGVDFNTTSGTYLLNLFDEQKLSALYPSLTRGVTQWYNVDSIVVPDLGEPGIRFSEWDDGTNLVATSPSKWYSDFIFVVFHDEIGDVNVNVRVAETEHGSAEDAEQEAFSAPVTYLDGIAVPIVRVVRKGSESNFSNFGTKSFSEDIRPIIGGGGSGAIAQDLWATILADTGSTTANTADDTLTFTGGGNIFTSITGDTVTIDFSDSNFIATQHTWTGDQNFTSLSATNAFITTLNISGVTIGTDSNFTSLQATAFYGGSLRGNWTVGNDLNTTNIQFTDGFGDPTLHGFWLWDEDIQVDGFIFGNNVDVTGPDVNFVVLKSSTIIATKGFFEDVNTLIIGAGKANAGFSTIEAAPRGSLNSSYFSIAGDSGTTAYETWEAGSLFELFSLNHDGRLQWGSGSGAVDTSLFRSAANILKTDDSLIVAIDLNTQGNLTVEKANPFLTIDSKGNTASILEIKAERTTEGQSVARVLFDNAGTDVAEIRIILGSTTTKGDLTLLTNGVIAFEIDEAQVFTFHKNTGPQIEIERSNKPTGTNRLGEFLFRASDGSNRVTGASITSQSTGLWTTTSRPSKIFLGTTKMGSTTLTTAMTIDQNQDIGIAILPEARFHIDGGIILLEDAAVNIEGKDNVDFVAFNATASPTGSSRAFGFFTGSGAAEIFSITNDGDIKGASSFDFGTSGDTDLMQLAANALTVNGTITIDAPTAQITFKESGSSRWAIIPHAATDELRFFSFGAVGDALTIANATGNAVFAGNVDIKGSTAPALTVEGTAGTSSPQIVIKNADRTWTLVNRGGAGFDDDFQILDNTAGTTPFHIESGDGNIGFGTTNPETHVHIQFDNTLAYSTSLQISETISDALEIQNANASGKFASFYMQSDTVSGGVGRFLIVSQGANDADFVWQLRDPSDTGFTKEKMRLTSDGRLSVNSGTGAAGQLDVNQTSTTAAVPVLVLDQGDASEPFIDFIGTSGSGQVNSISTHDLQAESDTDNVAAPNADSWSNVQMIQIDIGGTLRWIAVYQTES